MAMIRLAEVISRNKKSRFMLGIAADVKLLQTWDVLYATTLLSIGKADLVKKCPYCLGEVHDAAIVCPNCNRNLIVTVPMGLVEEQTALEQARKRDRFIARIVYGLVMGFLIACVVGAFLLLWNSY